MIVLRVFLLMPEDEPPDPPLLRSAVARGRAEVTVDEESELTTLPETVAMMVWTTTAVVRVGVAVVLGLLSLLSVELADVLGVELGGLVGGLGVDEGVVEGAGVGGALDEVEEEVVGVVAAGPDNGADGTVDGSTPAGSELGDVLAGLDTAACRSTMPASTPRA